MGTVFSVISHTHWDREWYLTFESFRIRLVQLMDHLLDLLDRRPEYRFHLDAQTIVLEDYLEIRPERLDDLRRHIAAGRILVGPWYIQNDFFLTSGEATIRNLLEGRRMAGSFGDCMKVGYTPDQFGLPSQLPQILARSGLDSCLFARGYAFDPPRRSEFFWRTEDGSEVLAVFMPYWYNNAQRFSREPGRARRLLELNRTRLRPYTGTDHYLLMNGVDHIEAQDDLLDILDTLNDELPEGDWISQDTMPSYMAQVRAALSDPDVYRGEMRHGGRRNLLAGTLSSRVYLKQQNVGCQALVEHLLEPLAVLAAWKGVRAYPAGFLRHLWKTLMMNHAHDSICGCSRDEVHRHMMDRFARVGEIGRDLLARCGAGLAARVARDGAEPDDALLVVANTLLAPRDGVVRMEIDFPRGQGVREIEILDSAGRRVPCDRLDRRETVRAVTSPLNLPGYMEVDRFRIAFQADDVPAMGYARWIVRPTASGDNTGDRSGTPAAPGLNPAACALENRWLSATLHPDGSVDLLDKVGGNLFPGLLRLEDREDIGDSYIHESAGLPPVVGDGTGFRVLRTEAGQVARSMTFAYSLSIPDCFLTAARRRSGRRIRMPVEVTLALDGDERFLRVSIRIDNRARDHWLRVRLPVGIDAPAARAASPFDAVLRPRRGTGQGDACQPACGFLDVSAPGRGLAILSDGLYEYEFPNDPDGRVFLTLLRATGHIHRDEADGNLGDDWLVPENQCPGRHEFRFALLPHDGHQPEGWAFGMAREYLAPLQAFCQPVHPDRFAVSRPFVQEPGIHETFLLPGDRLRPDLPATASLVSTDSPDMVLSCLKRAEDRDTFILRLFNGSGQPAAFRLRTGMPLAEAHRTDLMETRIEALPIGEDGRCLDLSAAPREIVTLELVPAPGD